MSRTKPPYRAADAEPIEVVAPQLEAAIAKSRSKKASTLELIDAKINGAGGPQAAIDRLVPKHPLDEIECYVGRFVVHPSEHARVAHVLWSAHTHLMEQLDSTPRILFLSPEPGSGKSRALEVTEPLVPRPMMTANMSASALFRSLNSDEGTATLLFDEVDTIFGAKTKDNNEDLRGLINSGHRRGVMTRRARPAGVKVVIDEFESFAAVAMAGIGDLPDTILNRSVIIHMRRRAPHETVEPYRHRLHFHVGEELRDRLAAWALTIAPRIGNPWPTMPATVIDRDADVWEGLITIADLAGGDWPERARAAAVALVADSKVRSPSLGIRLLNDLRRVFGQRDRMWTEEVIKALCALDDAPWRELKGVAINAYGISDRLEPYGVKPKNVRIDDLVRKGYTSADLYDAWQRYLPPLSIPTEKAATPATPATGVAPVAPVAAFQGNGPRAPVAPVAGVAAFPPGKRESADDDEVTE